MVLATAVAAGVGGFTPIAGAQPFASEDGRVELGLALRQLNSTGAFLMVTAHPDDENNALLARLAKGEGHRAVLLTATRGDGRPERDRRRVVRCPRGVADRRIARRPSAGRGRAVLHQGRRLRLFLQRRGDPRALGTRGDPRRHRPDDPHRPARRHRRPEPGRAGRRPASPDLGPAGAGGVPRRRRSRPLPGADRRGIATVAGAEVLFPRRVSVRVRTRAARGPPAVRAGPGSDHGRSRRLRPAARDHLRGDRAAVRGACTSARGCPN